MGITFSDSRSSIKASERCPWSYDPQLEWGIVIPRLSPILSLRPTTTLANQTELCAHVPRRLRIDVLDRGRIERNNRMRLPVNVPALIWVSLADIHHNAIGGAAGLDEMALMAS
jgi:hypothetical protein